MTIVCYFLQNWDPTNPSTHVKSKQSYIGYTVDLKQRLRRHRKEIKGGAKYTSRWKHVELIGYYEGFETKNNAMSFEWHAKRRNRRQLQSCKDKIKYWKKQNVHPRFAEFIETNTLLKFQKWNTNLKLVTNKKFKQI